MWREIISLVQYVHNQKPHNSLACTMCENVNILLMHRMVLIRTLRGHENPRRLVIFRYQMWSLVHAQSELLAVAFCFFNYNGEIFHHCNVGIIRETLCMSNYDFLNGTYITEVLANNALDELYHG